MFSSLFSSRRVLAVLALVVATITACSQAAPDPKPAPGPVNDPVGLLGSWKVTPIDNYPDEAELTFTSDGHLMVSDWCHGSWKGSWTVAGRSAISLGIDTRDGDQEKGPCKREAPWMTETQMYQIVDDSHVLFRQGDNPQTASLERTAYPESTELPAAWSAQPELPDGYLPTHEDSLRPEDWLIDGVPVTFHPLSGSRTWKTGDCPANVGSWSLSRYGYFAAKQSGAVPSIWCPPGPSVLDVADTTLKNTVRMGTEASAVRQGAAGNTLALVAADGTATIVRAVRPEDTSSELPEG